MSVNLSLELQNARTMMNLSPQLQFPALPGPPLEQVLFESAMRGS